MNKWWDVTLNPVTGCTPISGGCKNCYAARMTKRNLWGYDFTPGTFHPDRLAQLTRWRKPRRIFLCSMSDLFHEAVSDEMVWRVLNEGLNGNRRHTYMVLTKRAQRMRKFFTEDSRCFTPWPDPQLQLGVTVESVAYLYRVRELIDTIAAVRFVSCEPLLDEVDLSRWLYALNGVICGAETGPGKRPMELDWARSLRDQCVEAGVPFFYKQGPDGETTLDGKEWRQFPE